MSYEVVRDVASSPSRAGASPARVARARRAPSPSSRSSIEASAPRRRTALRAPPRFPFAGALPAFALARTGLRTSYARRTGGRRRRAVSAPDVLTGFELWRHDGYDVRMVGIWLHEGRNVARVSSFDDGGSATKMGCPSATRGWRRLARRDEPETARSEVARCAPGGARRTGGFGEASSIVNRMTSTTPLTGARARDDTRGA